MSKRLGGIKGCKYKTSLIVVVTALWAEHMLQRGISAFVAYICLFRVDLLPLMLAKMRQLCLLFFLPARFLLDFCSFARFLLAVCSTCALQRSWPWCVVWYSVHNFTVSCVWCLGAVLYIFVLVRYSHYSSSGMYDNGNIQHTSHEAYTYFRSFLPLDHQCLPMYVPIAVGSDGWLLVHDHSLLAGPADDLAVHLFQALVRERLLNPLTSTDPPLRHSLLGRFKLAPAPLSSNNDLLRLLLLLLLVSLPALPPVFVKSDDSCPVYVRRSSGCSWVRSGFLYPLLPLLPPLFSGRFSRLAPCDGGVIEKVDDGILDSGSGR